eukprot:1388677-Karenia_brevis.AAC.1
MRLQARLTWFVDERVADTLASNLRVLGRTSDEHRIRDLCHPECSHDWLWPLGSDAGAKHSHAEYVTAVRLRLGCAGPDEPA